MAVPRKVAAANTLTVSGEIQDRCSAHSQAHLVSDDVLYGEFPFIQRERELSHSLGVHESADRSPSHISRVKGPGESRRPFPSKTFSNLTKSEIHQVLEILHYSMDARTGDDVQHILQLLQRTVACPRVIGGVARLTTKGSFKEFTSMLNVSYSNDWVYAYCKNEYATVDPVLKSLLSTFQTQTWKQTYSTASSRKQLEFVEEARSFGLTHGITTGVLEQNQGFATFFSFAGGDANGTARYRGLLEYLIPYLHRVLIANTHMPLSTQAKGLSPREMTVLFWMKEGKTNWEIARIVGVTERTVRFHVEGIFMKLDASSRTQAVAVAMEHGLLQAG
ncbi:MAG: LuxR C-terminal-related transcriptional regulator [Nitrospirae bacterium]|nr:LuxR C-terminal-related transcriptional regulator [Nitrospirota bacterium]